MIETTTNYSGWYYVDREIEKLTAHASRFSPSHLSNAEGHKDSQENAESVIVKRNRTQLDLVGRWSWDKTIKRGVNYLTPSDTSNLVNALLS